MMRGWCLQAHTRARVHSTLVPCEPEQEGHRKKKREQEDDLFEELRIHWQNRSPERMRQPRLGRLS